MAELRFSDVEIELIKKMFEKYKFVCETEEDKRIISIYTEDASGNLVKWFYLYGYVYEDERYLGCIKETNILIFETRPDLTDDDCVAMFEELYDLLNCHDQNFMYKVINHDDWYMIALNSKGRENEITSEQWNEIWLNWDWEYRIEKCKLTENMYYILQLIERDLLVPSIECKDCFENKGVYTRFDNVKDSVKYSKKLLIPKEPKDSIALSLLIKQDLIRFDGEKYVVNDVK